MREVPPLDAAQTAVAADIWNTILSFTFLICGLLLIVIARQSKKAGNTYGTVSTGISAVIVLFLAFVNNVWGLFPTGNYKGYPFNAFYMWWFGGVAIVYLWYAASVWRKDTKEKRKSPDDLDEYWRLFHEQDTSLYQADISVKMEAMRKAFHLAGLLLVVAYYGLGFIGPVTTIVNNLAINHIYNQDPVGYVFLFGPQALYPYGVNDPRAMRDLTYFALLGTLTFVILSDFIRVLWGTRYSIYNKLTGKVLRGKEYKAAGPRFTSSSGLHLLITCTSQDCILSAFRWRSISRRQRSCASRHWFDIF